MRSVSFEHLAPITDVIAKKRAQILHLVDFAADFDFSEVLFF